MVYKFSKKKMVMAILVLLTLITMDTTFVSCAQGGSESQKVKKKVRFKVTKNNNKSSNTKLKDSKKIVSNLQKTSRRKKNELNKCKKYGSSEKNGKGLKVEQEYKKRRSRSQAKSLRRVGREVKTNKSKRGRKDRSKSQGPPHKVERPPSVSTQTKKINSKFGKAKEELDIDFDDSKLKLGNEQQELKSSGVKLFKNKKKIKKRKGGNQAKPRGRLDREVKTKSKRNIKVRSKSEGPPPTARFPSVNTQIREINNEFNKAKDELDMHFDGWKLKLGNEKQELENYGVAFFKNNKMESRNSGTLFFNQVGDHIGAWRNYKEKEAQFFLANPELCDDTESSEEGLNESLSIVTEDFQINWNELSNFDETTHDFDSDEFKNLLNLDKNKQQNPVINDTQNLNNATEETNFDKTTKMQYISVKVTVLIAALFVLGYFGYYAIFKKQPKTL